MTSDGYSEPEEGYTEVPIQDGRQGYIYQLMKRIDRVLDSSTKDMAGWIENVWDVHDHAYPYLKTDKFIERITSIEKGYNSPVKHKLTNTVAQRELRSVFRDMHKLLYQAGLYGSTKKQWGIKKRVLRTR